MNGRTGDKERASMLHPGLGFQSRRARRTDEGENHRDGAGGLGGGLFKCQADRDPVDFNINNGQFDFNINNGQFDFNINNGQFDGANHDSSVGNGGSAIPGGRQGR